MCGRSSQKDGNGHDLANDGSSYQRVRASAQAVVAGITLAITSQILDVLQRPIRMPCLEI